MKNTTENQESVAQRSKMSVQVSTPGRKLRNVINKTSNPRVTSRIGRKVHSNINFSKLDEVCLDVGKVDLSRSAKLNSDTCLSPKKLSPEANGAINTINCDTPNGHSEVATEETIWDNSKYSKKIKSCYVQLEGLEAATSRRASHVAGKRPFFDSDDSDEEWRGWASNIAFIERLGCELITVKEGDELSHVLVFGEEHSTNGHVSSEPKNGSSNNRSNCYETLLKSPSSGLAYFFAQKQKNVDGLQKENGKSTFVKENDIKAHTPPLYKNLGSTTDVVVCSIEKNNFYPDINKYHVPEISFSERENEIECLGEDFTGSFLGWSGNSKETADIECEKFMNYYRHLKTVKGVKG